MTQLAIKLVRGTDKADLIVADNNYYNLYVNSLQAIQRVTDPEMAGSGFASLKFYGGGTSADVVLGGGIGPQNPKTPKSLNLIYNAVYFNAK